MNDNEKKFIPLDSKELLKRLINEKKLIIENKKEAEKLIEKWGYTLLISNNRKLFYDYKNHEYKDNVKFSYIYSIAEFDRKLKNLVLEYVFIFENILKNVFVEMIRNKFDDSDYFNLKFYNPQKKIELSDFLISMNKKSSKNNKYCKRYIDQYEKVPCWAFFYICTLGDLETYFSLLNNEYQMYVSKKFNVQVSDFNVFLKTIHKVRNISVHNVPLYSDQLIDLKSNSLKIYKKLKIEKKNNKREFGTNKLFSLLIIFKYLLDKSDYNHFIDETDRLIKKVEAELPYEYFLSFTKLIGFPSNWFDIKKV